MFLLSGNPKPDFAVVSKSIPLLSRLIQHPDDEVKIRTIRSLKWLTFRDGWPARHQIQAVLDSGVMRDVVNLLGTEDAAVCAAALDTVSER